MIEILQIAAGVIIGQVVLTTFSFYMGRHYAKKRRALEVEGIRLLKELAKNPPKVTEEKKTGGQYL